MFYMRLFRRILTWFLVTVILYCALVANHIFCLYQKYTSWWNTFYDIASPLLGSAIVSFFIYFIVVFIPAQKNKRIIKHALGKTYEDVKHNIITNVVSASVKGGRHDLDQRSDLLEHLKTVQGFKETFSGGTAGHEGFYAFRNYMSSDVPEYRNIIIELRVLSEELNFVMHNYEFKDPKYFEFFKRLRAYLIRLELRGAGYEEEKYLSSLIWEMCGGFNIIAGFRDYDIVEEMIKEM